MTEILVAAGIFAALALGCALLIVATLCARVIRAIGP